MKAVLDGARFNTLKDRSGSRLSDAHPRAKLSEREPWVSPIYEQTSDFVHLSGRHFYSAIARTEEESRTAHFSISGEDPRRPEAVSYEVVDTLVAATTRLVGTMILAYLSVRAGRPPQRQLAPGGHAATRPTFVLYTGSPLMPTDRELMNIVEEGILPPKTYQVTYRVARARTMSSTGDRPGGRAATRLCKRDPGSGANDSRRSEAFDAAEAA